MNTTVRSHSDRRAAARVSFPFFPLHPAVAAFWGCSPTDRLAQVFAGHYDTANDSEVGPEIYPATFYVVRVNGNDLDTFAAETLEEALEMAMPDKGSVVHAGKVQAPDAGAARLLTPSAWNFVKPSAWKRYACAALLCLLSLPAFAAPCKVNVNSASPQELQLLSRTGPVLAERLVAGRPLDLPKLDAVKGIGEAWLAVNGPHVAFSGKTTCTEKIKAAPKVAAQGPKL